MGDEMRITVEMDPPRLVAIVKTAGDSNRGVDDYSDGTLLTKDCLPEPTRGQRRKESTCRNLQLYQPCWALCETAPLKGLP
jgi:hypothetical protein